jgi:hypothetical protein
MLKMALFVEGLLDPEDLIGLTPEKIERSAYRAINYSAARARTASKDEILRQVAFPSAYLNPAQGRLTVAQEASAGRLEATIVGRHRATSLARFMTRGELKKVGVSVAVRPGRTVKLERAFLMSLKSGTTMDTQRNLGLAIRVPKGTSPNKAYKPVRVRDGLYLLYGPSVNQVFQTVRQDVSPQAEADLAREFMRLIEMERKS